MGKERFWHAFLLVVATGLLLTAARLATPEDLMCADQERPVSYVLDVLRNGHWICQTDWQGAVASKPPLYTWLAALAALPFGRLNRLLLLAPSIVSVLLLSWLILWVGRARYGTASGVLGALAFLLSPITAWLIAVARTDNLFTLTIAMTAWFAFRAWNSGRGWTWFWLSAAAATLTKGPLGLLLGGIGLLAGLWETRDGTRLPLRGNLWPGIALYLVITLGWLALAYAQLGRAVVSRTLGEELVGSVHTGGDGLGSLKHFFIPALYVLGRFAPWSVFTCVGLWRVVRRPSDDADQRRFERFLFCWLVGGVIVFSVPAHQRVALVFPLLPPAAWLAGHEMAGLLKRLRPAPFLITVAACSLCVLGIIAFYYQKYRGDDRQIKQTCMMAQAAKQIEIQAGKDLPLVHVGTPFALQYFLNTMTPSVEIQEAARRLSGTDAVFVAASDSGGLARCLLGAHPKAFELLRWPTNGIPVIVILSNRPKFDRSTSAPML